MAAAFDSLQDSTQDCAQDNVVCGEDLDLTTDNIDNTETVSETANSFILPSGKSAASPEEDAADRVDRMLAALKQRPEMAQATRGDVENMLLMNEKLANKVVLNILIETLRTNPKISEPRIKKLIKLIEAKQLKTTGFVQIEFEGADAVLVENCRLIITLAVGPKDFVAQIDLPSDKYTNEIFQHYNHLKMAAKSYWDEFVTKNPSIISECAKARPDIRWIPTEAAGDYIGGLVVDKRAPTTMYFDADCERRVSICPFYVDKNGKMLMNTA